MLLRNSRLCFAVEFKNYETGNFNCKHLINEVKRNSTNVNFDRKLSVIEVLRLRNRWKTKLIVYLLTGRLNIKFTGVGTFKPNKKRVAPFSGDSQQQKNPIGCDPSIFTIGKRCTLHLITDVIVKHMTLARRRTRIIQMNRI